MFLTSILIALKSYYVSMNQEYFSVALSSDISLAVPLDSMGAVIQIEAKNICLIPGVADFWHGSNQLQGYIIVGIR